jgi:DNA-binding CsgD family transcriptional regulator
MTNALLSKPGFRFQFQGSDLDEFREVVGRSIRPCRFRARAVRYDAELEHHHVGSLGFSVVSVGPDIGVTFGPVEDSYLIQIPLVGSFAAGCLEPTRVYRDGDMNVVNPTAPLSISMRPGAKLLLVRIARSTLEEHARILGGTTATVGPRLLPESLPSTGSQATSLRRYLLFLHAESMDPWSPLHQGTAIRSAEQTLVSLMLALADGDAVHAGLRPRRDVEPLALLDQRRNERSDGASLFTPRELEIARLLAAGLNNREIASCLAISRNTVKEALKRIFRKADVDSRAELAARFAEAGLLQA